MNLLLGLVQIGTGCSGCTGPGSDTGERMKGRQSPDRGLYAPTEGWVVETWSTRKTDLVRRTSRRVESPESSLQWRGLSRGDWWKGFYQGSVRDPLLGGKGQDRRPPRIVSRHRINKRPNKERGRGVTVQDPPVPGAEEQTKEL